MKILHFLILSQLGTCFAGCGGYATAADLERYDMGPDACEARCSELGMRMGALALIDTSHAGCVCTPRPAAAAPQASAEAEQSAVMAALGAIIEDEQRRNKQQQQNSQRQRR